jgi:hypothetical protein
LSHPRLIVVIFEADRPARGVLGDGVVSPCRI